MADVIKSIKHSGGDYSTWQSWEDGQDGVLTDRQIGEVYDDSDWDDPCSFAGSTTTSSLYMFLRAVAGDEYDLITDDGVKNIRNNTAFTSPADEWCRVFYIFQESTVVSQTALGNCTTGGDNSWYHGCVSKKTVGTGTQTGFNAPIANMTFTCCIAIGSGGANGLLNGFNMQNAGTTALVVNCLATKVTQGAGVGINMDRASDINKQKCYNSIAWDNDTDFFFDTSVEHDYNISEDSSAGGEANGFGSVTMTDVLEAPTGSDFRPKSSGSAWDNGIDGDTIWSALTMDIQGLSWVSGDWNIGAYKSSVGGTAHTVSDTDNAAADENFTLEQTKLFSASVLATEGGAFARTLSFTENAGADENIVFDRTVVFPESGGADESIEIIHDSGGNLTRSFSDNPAAHEATAFARTLQFTENAGADENIAFARTLSFLESVGADETSAVLLSMIRGFVESVQAAEQGAKAIGLGFMEVPAAQETMSKISAAVLDLLENAGIDEIQDVLAFLSNVTPVRLHGRSTSLSLRGHPMSFSLAGETSSLSLRGR